MLLGVLQAVEGRGWEMDIIVHHTVTSLGIANKIMGFSFDTPSSNTGMMQGAYMSLENTLVALHLLHRFL